MTEKYLISVIVPVYGAEPYLALCIESICMQTYTNLEILLVDDGSPDNCPEICDEYALRDNRIKVLHQTNKGVSAARNAGINMARGDYITFVDSDDELFPNAIEQMLLDALSCDADIAYAVKCSIKPDGEVINIYEDGTCNIYDGLTSLCLSLDGERQTNSACAKLFKYAFLGDVRFEEGKSINEDGFFLFECYVKQPKVIQHNVCVYKYYIRDNSSSRKVFSEKYFDMIYFCERKKEIVNALFPEISDKLINMEVSTHLFFLETLCRTYDKKYRKDIRNSIRLVRKYYKVYVPLNNHEKQFSKIVYFGFYSMYKLLLNTKRMVSPR